MKSTWTGPREPSLRSQFGRIELDYRAQKQRFVRGGEFLNSTLASLDFGTGQVLRLT